MKIELRHISEAISFFDGGSIGLLGIPLNSTYGVLIQKLKEQNINDVEVEKDKCLLHLFCNGIKYQFVFFFQEEKRIYQMWVSCIETSLEGIERIYTSFEKKIGDSKSFVSNKELYKGNQPTRLLSYISPTSLVNVLLYDVKNSSPQTYLFKIDLNFIHEGVEVDKRNKIKNKELVGRGKSDMRENQSSISTKQILIFLFLVTLMYIMFLFALGFRYKTSDGGFRVFDSWNEEMLQLDPSTGKYKSIAE